MSFWILALLGLAIAFLYFSAFWVLQYSIKNSAVVDVGWAISVALVGGFFCWFGDGDLSRRMIASVLMLLWATQLSLHLYLRWRSHPEDQRYTQLKEEWGDSAQLRMFRFYQMQAIGAYLFALPMLVIASIERPLFWLDYIGIVIWIIAIAGEAISDWQLKQFKQDPTNKGEVCNVGLWRYSRHPNYFFEWFHWWTYVAFSITSPVGWLTMLAPFLMWYFLTKVTGIPTSEKQALKSRGEKYRKYQQTTNAFFPGPPRQLESNA